MSNDQQNLDARLDAFVALGEADRRLEHAQVERQRAAQALADEYLAHLEAGSPALDLDSVLPFRVDQYRAAVLEVDLATEAVAAARAATETPAQ